VIEVVYKALPAPVSPTWHKDLGVNHGADVILSSLSRVPTLQGFLVASLI